MGISGAGKTTVGARLAADLGARFVDADDLHPPENIARLRAGIALDDADRAPWLRALADAIDGWLERGDDVVLACSALRAAYRDQLRRDPARVVFVHLEISPALARARVSRRTGHFLRDPHIVDSQLRTLEPPEDAIVVDAALPPDVLVAAIVRELPPLR